MEAVASPKACRLRYNRLRLDSDPKIRLAPNHCPLHSPFRSESSPRTQGVEFFVIGRLSSAAASRGERLEDSFNPLTHSQNWDFDRFTLLLAIFARLDAAPPFVVSHSRVQIQLNFTKEKIHHISTCRKIVCHELSYPVVPHHSARQHGYHPHLLSSLCL